jgi:hypothetical protein
VLAVEDAGCEHAAEPAQPLPGVGLQHSRAEGDGAATDGLHAVGQALADAGGAMSLGDERVPLGVGGEVGEDLPDPVRGGLDVDLGVELLGHAALLMGLTLLAQP